MSERKSGRRYVFSWALLGDIERGRPTLGPTTQLEIYRLMQFTIRDVLERSFGTEMTDEILYDAGKLAGIHFYENKFAKLDSFDDFIGHLQSRLQEYGVGILRVEEADLDRGYFVITVSEDLDCSGLPELDCEICAYDEGFIAGILERYTGNRYKVREINCWCTGDRVCRFTAEVVG